MNVQAKRRLGAAKREVQFRNIKKEKEEREGSDNEERYIIYNMRIGSCLQRVSRKRTNHKRKQTSRR